MWGHGILACGWPQNRTFCLRRHFVLQRADVQGQVHQLRLAGRHGALWALDVLRAEQELPRQVTLLDEVHVGDDDAAFGRAALSWRRHSGVEQTVSNMGTLSN